MNSIRNLLLPATTAVVVALGACTSSTVSTATTAPNELAKTTLAATDTQPQEGAAPSNDAKSPAATDGQLESALLKIADGYKTVEGKWNGFVPNEHPVVLPFKDANGKILTVLALNHPDPAALGDATLIDTSGTAIDKAHRIDNPTNSEALEALESFDFHATLGGVDSFAMIAGGGDAFFDPLTNDYTSTLLHELFHRYQDQAFKGSLGNQDVNGYAYTEENLRLALLEERALAEAIKAPDAGGRNQAAQRFAGLRIARLAGDDRVELDEAQEMFEGSARYLEHKLSGSNEAYVYHDGNFDRDLITNFSNDQGVKDSFGFGRFYSSGAAIMRVLELMGTENVDKRIEAGEYPSQILIAELGITADETTELVEAAEARYDPLNELRTQAAEASKQAEGEGDPFDDVAGGSDDTNS